MWPNPQVSAGLPAERARLPSRRGGTAFDFVACARPPLTRPRDTRSTKTFEGPSWHCLAPLSAAEPPARRQGRRGGASRRAAHLLRGGGAGGGASTLPKLRWIVVDLRQSAAVGYLLKRTEGDTRLRPTAGGGGRRAGGARRGRALPWVGKLFLRHPFVLYGESRVECTGAR